MNFISINLNAKYMSVFIRDRAVVINTLEKSSSEPLFNIYEYCLQYSPDKANGPFLLSSINCLNQVIRYKQKYRTHEILNNKRE